MFTGIFELIKIIYFIFIEHLPFKDTNDVLSASLSEKTVSNFKVVTRLTSAFATPFFKNPSMFNESLRLKNAFLFCSVSLFLLVNHHFRMANILYSLVIVFL